MSVLAVSDPMRSRSARIIEVNDGTLTFLWSLAGLGIPHKDAAKMGYLHTFGNMNEIPIGEGSAR